MRSKVFEDSSLGSKVCLICLYTIDRLSNPNGISASGFRICCLVRDGPSVLEMTLFGLTDDKRTTHDQLAAHFSRIETAKQCAARLATQCAATSLASTAVHDTGEAASPSLVVISHGGSSALSASGACLHMSPLQQQQQSIKTRDPLPLYMLHPPCPNTLRASIC